MQDNSSSALTPLNLKPLQVEAILLSRLILIAHGLTWEFMTQPEEQ